MGCSGSKAPPSAPVAALAQRPVKGLLFEAGPSTTGKPAAVGKAKGKGKGKCTAKGKGKGKSGAGNKWQIVLENRFQDYGAQEDMILKRAYMTGQKNARFELRGQRYEYNFTKMLQINKSTNKERRIRPPCGPRPPRKPLLPTGPMIIITVRAGQAGTMISIKDPNNLGQSVRVFVPAHAKPGQKLAVPVPRKGEAVEEVQKKQRKHDDEHGTKSSEWSTGAKVAAGGAALAAVGVGGVILGDHLAGGDLAETIGEAAADAGEDAADAVGDWAAGVAEDPGAWAEGAAEDVGEWLGDAAEDLGDWAEAAGEDIADFEVGDAADWFGDAGEDIGDFVMDLF